MNDDEIRNLIDMKRAADAIPACSLLPADLDAMVMAVCAERDRQRDVPLELAACACMGPRPYCRCALRAIRQEIAAAWAALDERRGGVPPV